MHEERSRAGARGTSLTVLLVVAQVDCWMYAGRITNVEGVGSREAECIAVSWCLLGTKLALSRADCRRRLAAGKQDSSVSIKRS